MNYIAARYALWILLCIPIIILGFALSGNLFDELLRQLRAGKAKQEAKQAKQARGSDSEEFTKSRGSGL